jgi:hypothetical protein
MCSSLLTSPYSRFTTVKYQNLDVIITYVTLRIHVCTLVCPVSLTACAWLTPSILHRDTRERKALFFPLKFSSCLCLQEQKTPLTVDWHTADLIYMSVGSNARYPLHGRTKNYSLGNSIFIRSLCCYPLPSMPLRQSSGYYEKWGHNLGQNSFVEPWPSSALAKKVIPSKSTRSRGWHTRLKHYFTKLFTNLCEGLMFLSICQKWPCTQIYKRLLK